MLTDAEEVSQEDQLGRDTDTKSAPERRKQKT